MAEFTGERLIPGEVDIDLLNEHMARYHFAVRLARGKRVLDAGCGAGYGSAELADVAESVTAIDIAPERAVIERFWCLAAVRPFIAQEHTHQRVHWRDYVRDPIFWPIAMGPKCRAIRAGAIRWAIWSMLNRTHGLKCNRNRVRQGARQEHR